jgi:hypothetical protein
MRRISSRDTYFLKRIFPIIVSVVFVFVFGDYFIEVIRGQDKGPPVWFMILMVPFTFVIGYFAMKKTAFDLVDAVFDEGESLLVRNNNQEERISLSDIDEASYSLFGARMTLTLKRPSVFGTEIAFLPKTGFATFIKSAEMKDLIRKIEAQRAV